MTKTFLLSVFAILLCGQNVFLRAQQPEVAPEKKKIIAEIIAVTKAEQRTEETMVAMLKQMQASYPAIIKSTLAGFANLTDAQRTALEAELIRRNDRFATKFNERLRQKINFREFTEQSIYAIYDKFFGEDDLKNLLAFYKTPTGQKLNTVLPEMMTESIKISQELLLPKITSVVNEIVQDEIREIRQTSPTK